MNVIVAKMPAGGVPSDILGKCFTFFFFFTCFAAAADITAALPLLYACGCGRTLLGFVPPLSLTPYYYFSLPLTVVTAEVRCIAALAWKVACWSEAQRGEIKTEKGWNDSAR
uniref:Uncharacterized protein n=1 Tax=Trypanosoma congolense (strain IL3000) TaxID=1068625 RepID=G0UPN1_TRYCI|nr:hypothetical protein, unlikely [Trypanosoma congolense IL3000]